MRPSLLAGAHWSRIPVAQAAWVLSLLCWPGLDAGEAVAELRRLQVVEPDRPELPADKVPTFDEALAVMKGRIHVYLDFKSGSRALVIAYWLQEVERR